MNRFRIMNGWNEWKWKHLKGSLFHVPGSLVRILRDSYHPPKEDTDSLTGHTTSHDRDLKSKPLWVEPHAPGLGRMFEWLQWANGEEQISSSGTRAVNEASREPRAREGRFSPNQCAGGLQLQKYGPPRWEGSCSLARP